MKKKCKYYRCNPYLGCQYEITEKQALKKINNRWWTAVWDDYWQKFSDSAWYNIKDPDRDWVFKVEIENADLQDV